MKDFIPASDGDLVTFATNYKAKLDLRGILLGMTPAQIIAEKAVCDAVISAIGTYGVAKSTYEGAVSAKNEQVDTSVAAFRNFAKDIKRSPAYTEAIGHDFGIMGTRTTVDVVSYKTRLRIQQHPGYVTLKFTKKGVEGINLYTRLKGEMNWIKLGFYAHSPCVDSRPLTVAGQPENREYLCVGVIKDHEIGLQSDIASLAFAG